MTLTSRREAVRLLLMDFDRAEREARTAWTPAAHAGSISALSAAIDVLAKRHPKHHTLVCWYKQHWRDAGALRPDLRQMLDDALAYLLRDMPEAVVVSPSCLSGGPAWLTGDDEPDDEGLCRTFNALDEATRDELTAVRKDEEQRIRDEADAEDESGRLPDDPDARPAPAPLTVVAPHRAAADGRVSTHPQRGTPQHREARAEWHDRPQYRSTADDSRAVEWAFGDEGGEESSPTYGIVASGATGAPIGRPRRGTVSPEDAERLLVERCAGHTVADLRDCLKPGKPRADVRSRRETLARAVGAILETRSATREALAGALGCNVRTVDRLRDEAKRTAAA